MLFRSFMFVKQKDTLIGATLGTLNPYMAVNTRLGFPTIANIWMSL